MGGKGHGQTRTNLARHSRNQRGSFLDRTGWRERREGRKTQPLPGGPPPARWMARMARMGTMPCCALSCSENLCSVQRLMEIVVRTSTDGENALLRLRCAEVFFAFRRLWGIPAATNLFSSVAALKLGFWAGLWKRGEARMKAVGILWMCSGVFGMLQSAFAC